MLRKLGYNGHWEKCRFLLKKGKVIFQASKQEGIQDAILRDKTGGFRQFLEASFQNTLLQVEL